MFDENTIPLDLTVAKPVTKSLELHLSPSNSPEQSSATEQLLRVYVRSLTLADAEACFKLENEVFPPPERCSREKFIYRLSVCPELSLGLFSVAYPNSPMSIATTATSPRIVDSPTSELKEVLVAHTVSTKCVDAAVTDDAMGLPAEFDPSSERYQDPKLRGWSSSSPSPSLLGHQEAGETLGLHSLGVLPEYQGKGFGKTILKAYIQQMRGAGVARRIALITHERLIQFYKKFGFIHKGKSEVNFGGGDWHDMVLEFSDLSSGELH